MTKTLNMPFRNTAGSVVNFTLVSPKDGLTKAEVVATQALFISKNLFTSSGGNLEAALEPTVLIRDTGALL